MLFKEIDSLRHKATVKDGVLNITLCKKEVGIWGKLTNEGTEEDIENLKREASVLQSAQNESLEQQRHERKLAEEKNSLRKQMKLEEMERTRVENMKLEEKTAAEKEVYEAFAQMQVNNSIPTLKSDSKGKAIAKTSEKKKVAFGDQETPASIDSYLQADDIDEAQPMPISFDQTSIRPKREVDFNDIDEDEEDYEDKGTSVHSISAQNNSYDQVEELDGSFVEEEEEVRYVPPPSSTGLSENADQKLGISFTPRVFPTPMRESKAAEEEDWVAKNRRHIKKHGVLGKSKL